ncbi:MAG: DUF6338 family protein [Angustibacter sp.]
MSLVTGPAIMKSSRQSDTPQVRADGVELVAPLPSTIDQLFVVLLFVLPGSVYQFVRTRLRGPAPDDASAVNRVLRALGVSALLVSLYTVIAGPYLVTLIGETRVGAAGWATRIREIGLCGVVLLIAIPAALAMIDHLRRRYLPTPQWLRVAYDPTPSAWDFAFANRKETYIRLLTADDRWLGGWWGKGSWVSGYPEPRDIFISVAHQMKDNGSFGDPIEGSGGLYVRCDDVRAVEFIDPLSGECVKLDDTELPSVGVP